MLYSQLFGKPLKDISRDIVAISHKLLTQGGFIRPLSAGRYSFLPLGFRVSKKIEQIIREEVEKTGAQELIVPTLHPIELWKQANRDKKFGDAMMRVVDRNKSDFTLGATAEVVMLDLVKQFKPTYKDLPINIYQFSQKFRDEARASGGLLRVREFVMKDGYSFHADEKDLQTTYKKYWDAYLRIAKRLNLDVTVVESDNGAIGGSASHEFMVIADIGEDTIVKCNKCDYSANLERAEFVRKNINLDEDVKPLKIVKQPEWVETMEDNVKHYGKTKEFYLKNVVYKDVDGKIIIAVVRGDLAINPAKLAKLYGAKGELEPATDDDLKKINTRPGWVHSWGHPAIYIGDLSLKTVHNFIGGQKNKSSDSINVNYGKDFKCRIMGDIAEAQDGDICSKCRIGKLKFNKAVEFGNIFNIGYTYSDPMKGTFVDKDGNTKKLWMGSYGIGIGRAMAIVVEKNNDSKGIIWPKEIAPFQVHLIGLDMQNKFIKDKAFSVYKDLSEYGIEVLFDNREGVRAGVKFADADLIGAPYRMVISEKSLAQQAIEVKRRSEDKINMIPLNKPDLFKNVFREEKK